MKVTKPDENENVVMQPNLQPALSIRFRNWMLLFSASGWTKPQLSVKRHLSVQNGMMNVENALKTGKTRRSLLGTGANTGVCEMKEDNIVNDSELAASLTLSEESKFAVSHFFKTMTPLYPIYNENFRILVVGTSLLLERI